MNLITLAEMGLIPDSITRLGIRRLLKKRRRETALQAPEIRRRKLDEFTTQLRQSPLAVDTDAANTQHYEVPAEFFQYVLGPRLKYSSCMFADPRQSLAEAEDEMLQETCDHAEIEDGMRILELGCGWGSLTLWMAEKYPNSQVTAISNSIGQREFIEGMAEARQLTNVRVVTADMKEFSTEETFDRVVSVEMFEHMRNYELLFRRVAGFLKPHGKVFVHVFCHRDTPYLFETEGADNWMGRHFFTGGLMPSEDLFQNFADDLQIERQWQVNGLHYWRTCEAWLKNLDRNRDAVLRRFQQDLPAGRARIQLQRWRMFFMACAELFRYSNGTEWYVAHYLFNANVKPISGREIPALERWS